MTWRPIKEAPTDGTRILLSNGRDWPSSVYVGYYGSSPFNRERKMRSERGWLTEPGGYLRRPAYWMPLPTGPKRQ